MKFEERCPDGQKCGAVTTGCLVGRCQRRTPRNDEQRKIAEALAWNAACVWEWAEQLERELSADAKRYQWLRNGVELNNFAIRFGVKTKEEMDAAIDAAMERTS